MHGDPGLGALLRKMRQARGLTLAVLARRAGCSVSLLSQIETGSRVLKPQLAARLDAAFGGGGTVSVLAAGAYPGDPEHQNGPNDGEFILVRVPQRGSTVPVSRRELLAALGVGALSGSMLGGLQRAAETISPDEELLAELDDTLVGLQSAGRVLPPGQLVGPLTGQIALIDAVRRRAPAALRPAFTLLQTRGAEFVSWMAEESGDLPSALYWADRVQQWADALGWPSMVGYAHVRRSMLAISYASDGVAAVEQADQALHVHGAAPRVKAMAAKQMAFGLALMGRPDASRRALDATLAHLAAAGTGDDGGRTVGQRSVGDADLWAIYKATCDVYLGGGTTVIDTLEPRMDGIAARSKRTHAITSAKCAQAYANAGEPGLACATVFEVIGDAVALDSQSARAELRRVLPTLDRWPRRSDVQEVRHRLAGLL
ncbi:helix-turn-helix domain-containing protein [Actinomadura chibensis]|uniref:Helix-turn-helix domain-containing protein n=1 Tax=Actinomadura chibensis TaxID=392828 RepID=A0A5D0NIK2_9ACTN|nr:helix-turn-helix transcriptional regulator [Actinomadura chibensis]TYB44250.1 helix-turn-helix domain-containing protein [Actinomadura chibensis]